MRHDLNVLGVAVVGSTAYGLSHPGSDVDRLGVFVADTATILGLDGAKEADRSVVQTNPDVTLHEVGKFFRLCLKGNPTVVELLFADLESSSPHMDVTRSERRAFLSTQAVRKAYGGYAVQQAKRLQRRHAEGRVGFSADLAKRTAKHGRHCYRLLLQAQELLATGELSLDVSKHRDEIFAFGELAVDDPDAFASTFDRLLQQVDTVQSVLPDRPDRSSVNDLLVTIRRDLF